MLVVAHERLGNSEMPEQMDAVPRILTGDEVGFLQRIERTERDVAEIANGRGNEEEHFGQLRVEG